MTLLAPWWLLVLPVAALAVIVVAVVGRRAVPVRQHRLATWARLAGLTALVLALAQPVVARPVGERSVLFLLDRSASVPAAARPAQDAYVAAALDSAGRGDHAGVAAFGAEMRLVREVADAADYEPQQVEIDEAATDLAAALRAAAAALPAVGSRRIVVLTDGVETVGAARAAAADLQAIGVAVDVVAVGGPRTADALVARVALPATVREGEVAPVRVTVDATEAGPATVELAVDGVVAHTQQVDLVPGANRVEFSVPAPEPGPFEVAATVRTSFDTIPDNDTGLAVSQVIGPAQVAIVEGRAGDGEQLAAALAAGGITAEVVSGIPGEEDLLGFDGVVLVNVPAPPAAVTESLRAYVEELGRALVVVGGDQAYGLGDYDGSALEELLPVRSNPQDQVRRLPVAEVLVVDTSGSMGQCHCGGPEDDFEFIEGGVNKTDITKAGAALAIEALNDTDRVGVLSFSSGLKWTLPLAPKPEQEIAESALSRLSPDGNTSIAPALYEAMRALEDAEEDIRHIVLFTDGWDPNEFGLLPVARDIADAGITLSVLGTGEGTGETLKRMAEIGGGRFYPGRDLEQVPEVFAEETRAVVRELAQEGSFLPALAAASPVTAGLASAPPLRGYVAATPKSAASVPLEVGPGDPLLATWQRGLGRVTAWTSDATTRWSADWVTWEGFAEFWGRVLRDTLPSDRYPPPEVDVDGGVLRVGFTASAPGDAAAPADAVAVARVRAPDGDSTALTLQRVGPDRFEGEVRVGDPGAYWVSVGVESGTGVHAAGSAGAVVSYPPEFAYREADPALAADIAALTGGRVDPAAEAAFDPVPSLGRARWTLWPWLAGVALALFLADVALRRLVLEAGDLRRIGAAVARPFRRQPEPEPAEPE